MTKQIIIIAWIDKTGMRNTGQMERFDGYNWRPKFESTWEGKAAVWSSEMSRLEDCQRYLKTDRPNGICLVLPDTKDVLSIAKEIALKECPKIED